jgi:methylase of polypeptide subunit release factors
MKQNEIVSLQADEFQENILRGVNNHIAPYVMTIKGINLTLFPYVFNPTYAKAAIFFLDHLGVEEGDHVLDPFTGSGIDAIVALKQGALSAVAVDKFTMPYLCAKYNSEILGLNDKLDVRQGDVFSSLKKNEKFDLIIANPPFRDMCAKSESAAALRDEGYVALRKFFKEAKSYLNENGRIRLLFADVGEMDLMEKIAEENGFNKKIIAESKFASHVRIRVYEFT